MLALLALAGCTKNNGLPDVLLAHLKSRGITLEPLRVAGPLSQGYGYVVAKYDDRLAQDIVSNFEMRKMTVNEKAWIEASRGVEGMAMAEQLWGVEGAALSQLKLADGRRFEHLYLLASPVGEMYLLAQYAK